jgi:ribonuclease HII
MFKHEKQKLKDGYSYVIGCDEVGRGCLAGPVVAGAVVFEIPSDKIMQSKSKQWMKEVRDSKLLNASKRSILDSQIRFQAVTFGIGVVSSSSVDKNNIHNASLLAMHKAVQEVLKKLSKNSKVFLMVDGKFVVPKLHIKQEAVVGGDSKIFSISAASIIAKVYRDDLMVKLDNKFPKYNFPKHKGYATLEHRLAIEKHGLSSIHRKSFCKKYIV